MCWSVTEVKKCIFPLLMIFLKHTFQLYSENVLTRRNLVIISDTQSHLIARVDLLTQGECATGRCCGPLIRCAFPHYMRTENPGLKNSSKASRIKTCRRPKVSALSVDPRYTEIYYVIVLISHFALFYGSRVSKQILLKHQHFFRYSDGFQIMFQSDASMDK